MTTAKQTFNSANESRFAEFRKVEQTVWDHYELEPEETHVGLGSDQVVRIHDVGTGEPILFVHGSGGSGVYWAPLVEELTNHFRCVLMD